ncbi:hypothetical protein [Chryseobacterium koreense]|uniref:Tubby C 2 family protein n=1 Tax=Chryseobacterium koreense CCUG 49689 TaxID=1304281 RepID=A0A0J7ISE1_9FLAO|nr:hypothetical protein [Chryseobacterium koreense]KMQ69073.1 hypothetical protein ACM44_14540 [Chryseobacterium koreense CCUG 49689]MBB5333527.1 hypothetical protein [Chryseobacterium koreense]
MEKYRAIIKRGKYSYYYKGDELVFTLKLKSKSLSFGFSVECFIYDINDNEILAFMQNNFIIGIKLKLLTQSLPHIISIERKNIDSYNMKVMGKEIYLKITYMSYLMKSFGEFFIDGRSYGKVVRVKKNMMRAEFEFNFEEDSEINYYCMILFTMHTVDYSNVGY